MSTILRTVVVAAAVVVVLAAPAGAQVRDPFDPVIQPGTADTTVTTTTDGTADGDGVDVAPTGETLSNTGSDVTAWIPVALGIILVGAGGIYLARLSTRPLI